MGSRYGPLPDGMRVAVNGWPSIVPPTLTGRLVPKRSAEPRTVTKVAKAPSFWIRAVKVTQFAASNAPSGRVMLAWTRNFA